jgi:hypothetical protein
MIKKERSVISIGITIAIIHALTEAAVVLLFFIFGQPTDPATIIKVAFITTGVGTIIHHAIDYVIAVVIYKALEKAKAVKALPKLI